MKTIRRLIHREALGAVTFVTVGFLALFFFFDLVDELRWVAAPGRMATSYRTRCCLWCSAFPVTCMNCCPSRY